MPATWYSGGILLKVPGDTSVTDPRVLEVDLSNPLWSAVFRAMRLEQKSTPLYGDWRPIVEVAEKFRLRPKTLYQMVQRGLLSGRELTVDGRVAPLIHVSVSEVAQWFPEKYQRFSETE